MFRKAVLSAAVLMMASSAFATGSARETGRRNERDAVHATGARSAEAGQTNKSAEHAAVRTEVIRSTDGVTRDAAIRIEDISNDPTSFKVSGDAVVGVAKFNADVAKFRAQELAKGLDAKTASENAMKQALAERGTTEKELLETCVK